MKILFVCQQYIHAARWINQLKDSGHKIYVFDCLDKPIHKDLIWTNYTTNWSKRKIPNFKGEYILEKKFPYLFKNIEPYIKVTASEKLVSLIKKIKPDLVHSLEMQSQTYHLLKARKKISFKWAYFSWGSDLYLYLNDKKHNKKIQSVLTNINYLFIDNFRDISLARNLGFKGKTMPVFPGGGGYDLMKYSLYRKPILERKLIIIKGYHHWAGRALSILEALVLIVNEIRDYDIYVYSAHNCVIKKIKELNENYNLNIEYSSRYNQISHTGVLNKFGKAKIAIGNNISDGIPNTLLEAIILGAFPIQSNPGGVTKEYINDGVNGFLIDNPEDVVEISKLIKKALESPNLLKLAYDENQKIAEGLSYKKVQNEVLKIYDKIASEI
jgi:glycosyltransferase involved in cell wall biosynthesis